MTRSLRGRASERAPQVALACFVAAALPALAAPARSGPAVWTVRDADSTIHLVGAGHPVEEGLPALLEAKGLTWSA